MWHRKFPIVIGVMLVLGVSNSTRAQIGVGGSSLPSDRYYNVFREFYSADYMNAGGDFNRGSKSAYHVGDKYYLDSVCYQTMIGECYYHLGDYANALQFYEQALDLYVSQLKEDWQGRVEPPGIITARQDILERTKISWGAPKRQGAVANIPRGMSTLFGRLDAARAFVEGGLVEPPEQRNVDVQEIMRCTALALHRRRNILGATAKYSPVSSEIVSALSTARGSGSLFRAWNGVLLGLAQATMEDYEVAKGTLTGSLQFNGGMDHNLTPVALISLAQISFVTGDRASAAELALEASYSAAMHGQYDLIEESLSLGTIIHLMSEKTAYPPLQSAIQWAASEGAKLLNTSLIERLAACYIEAGDAESADRVLREASKPMRSSSLSKAVVNSRLRFVSAQLAFLRGDKDAMNQLNGAIEEFRAGSRWLFQLGLADSLAISGDISGRKADQLYSALLRDPTKTEWLIEPFECLTFLRTPHVEAMERWFETKLLNKQYDKAIEVAELVRRHRFYANLPMGGRLLAFRWMLEGPTEALTAEMQKQRTSFMTRNPDYKELSDRAKEIRKELLTLPLKPDEESIELKKQTDLFVELAKVSQSQEAIIASYAVQRQPADVSFPPQDDLSSFYDRIQPHQIAYVSLSTRNGVHAFLVARNQYKYLGTAPARQVGSNVSKFLKKIGLQDESGGVDVDLLTDDTWTPDANRVAKSIFIDGADVSWDEYKELVVVPDGVLWYVPFELLQLEKGAAVANPAAGALDPAGLDPADADPDKDPKADPDAKDKKPKKTPRRKKDDVDPAKLEMLGDKIQIRYSPTLFLAFGQQRPDRTIARTAVMAGRMHPKGEIEVTQEAVKKIQADIPDAVAFEEKTKIPSNYYGTILDRMIVCSDIKSSSKGGVFAMNPAYVDRDLNQGSNLASWLSLPFWGPEHIVLPGFTTGGAGGGRSKGNGQDIFLTACAILGSGSRSIMFSRWRVGGENSLELTRHYAKNLSEMTPARALKEGISESKKLELNFEVEPRIKAKKVAAPIKATHPFFWAGHMLIEVPDSKTCMDPNLPDVDQAGANVPDPADVQPPPDEAEMADDKLDPAAIPDPNLPDEPADKDGKLIKEEDKVIKEKKKDDEDK